MSHHHFTRCIETDGCDEWDKKSYPLHLRMGNMMQCIRRGWRGRHFSRTVSRIMSSKTYLFSTANDRWSSLFDSSPRRLRLQEIAVCIFLLLFSCYSAPADVVLIIAILVACLSLLQTHSDSSWGGGGRRWTGSDKQRVQRESKETHLMLTSVGDISVKDNQSLASASAHIENYSFTSSLWMEDASLLLSMDSPFSLFLSYSHKLT